MKRKDYFIIIVLICLMPLFTLGGGNGHKDTKLITDDYLKSYFYDYNIAIDSCSNITLYQTVYQWLGTHYKYKNKKGRGGIDCSGFTKVIYHSVYNESLVGGSHDIFPKTKPLNKDELQEGDMVFFKIRRGRISHVGVYLGNNKFVHSAVNGGVRISDLNEPYYKKYFFKGGRI